MSDWTQRTGPHNASDKQNHRQDHEYERFTKQELYQFLQSRLCFMWEIDENHIFTYVSDNINEVTPFEKTSLLGMHTMDIVAQMDGANASNQGHQDLTADRKPFRNLIACFRDPQGNRNWYSISADPKFDENGAFAGYRGTGTNVSDVMKYKEELYEVRDELAQSRQLLESVFDSLDIGVIVYDKDDRLVLFNDQIKELYSAFSHKIKIGMPREEIIRRSLTTGLFHHKEEGGEKGIEKKTAQILKEGWAPQFSREQHLGDGRWLQIRNRRLESGLLISVCSDITIIKDREERLSELLIEAQFASDIFNSLDQGIYVKDKDLKYVSCNHAFEDLFGWKLDHIEGKKDFDLLCPNAASRLTEMENLVLSDGMSTKTLEERPCKDGVTSWHLDRKSRIINRHGQVFLVGFLSDVTDLKNSEAEAEKARGQAEEASARLQSAIDSLDDCFAIWDKDERLLAFNTSYAQTFAFIKNLEKGIKFEDLVNELAFSGVIQEAIGREQQWIEDLLHTRRETYKSAITDTSNIIEKRADNKWFMRREQRTQLDDLVVIHTNISDIKMREEEAQEARENLVDVLESMPAGILIYDKDDKFVLTNQAFCKGLPAMADVMQEGSTLIEALTAGRNAGYLSVTGNKKLDKLHDEDEEKWMKTILKVSQCERAVGECFVEGAGWFKTIDCRTKNGNYIGIRIDINADKERETLLAEAKQNAEIAMRAKSEFLANMSHEIRTPMNGVLGMAELLASTQLDQKQQKFTEVIVKSADALLTIINDILDFSKIDAGQLALESEPFTLSDAVNDVATLISVNAEEKELELIVRIQPTLPENYIGDAGRLRQMITNLAGNAIKFTNYGHVFIDVSGQEEDDIAHLRISVTDTGIGIPEDNLSSIFEKFQQVDSSSTRNHEGTGLGLAITSRLAEMMHGEIGVESILGQGSCFWFDLKLPVHRVVQDQMNLNQDISGARVIIIDDNAVNRTILLEQMAAWSFDACAANSGPEGLEVLNAANDYGLRVDCILLDAKMPGMNGVAVTRYIRNHPTLSKTPIIMLTSLDHVFTPEEKQELKLNDHLVKPVRSSKLHETMVKVIQVARHEHESANQITDVVAQAMQTDHIEEHPKGSQFIGPKFETQASTDELQHNEESLDEKWKELEAQVAPRVQLVQNGDEAHFFNDDNEPPLQTSKQLHHIDILIAEDNDVNQLLITQILCELPYTFEIVTNGEMVVEVWEDLAPRLVLMDVSMPHMNGLEATAHIRVGEQRLNRSHTPIIGVTAHALKGDKERCMESGMDDYLSKPISPKALQKKIEEWISWHENMVKVV